MIDCSILQPLHELKRLLQPITTCLLGKGDVTLKPWIYPKSRGVCILQLFSEKTKLSVYSPTNTREGGTAALFHLRKRGCSILYWFPVKERPLHTPTIIWVRASLSSNNDKNERVHHTLVYNYESLRLFRPSSTSTDWDVATYILQPLSERRGCPTLKLWSKNYRLLHPI